MDAFNQFLSFIVGILWNNVVLYAVLGVGILFTIWSGFCQWRALTHGTQVIRGAYDDKNDPGAINHFQALSAALSGTVGLGNIGGVALAVALGGPGAVFWMWVVGVLGMAIKTIEVTLSMIYRNTHDPDNPHGGPMWVASKGLAAMGPKWKPTGQLLAVLFCCAILVSCLLDGNMFQAWNVGAVTEEYFRIPAMVSGVVLAAMIGMVIIGGIKRIGKVAGILVPVMVVLYLAGTAYVLAINFGQIPDLLVLIVKSAFSAQHGTGAFLGGTAGYGLAVGMRRALYSNEAGRGSSPIAHSAVKTDEPVREGVVAGLEPFIDTIVVCTLTALVILSSGLWNRAPDAEYLSAPHVVMVQPGVYSVETRPAPPLDKGSWREGDDVYMIVDADQNAETGNTRHRLNGKVALDAGVQTIHWDNLESAERPRIHTPGVYLTYAGATLTAKAFDNAFPGLGKWLITLATWLFAVSTIISWNYYGEQAVNYLLGERGILPYRLLYCALIVVATTGFISTPDQLDNFTGIGTGLMLWVNVPIILIFSQQAIRAYKEYIGRLKSGQMERNPVLPKLFDVFSGRDTE